METIKTKENLLKVILHINNSDEYYQQGLLSKGVDFHTLTHGEICIQKAIYKVIEADAILEVVENYNFSNFEDTINNIYNLKKY